jgi:hypothetical protein
MSTDSLYQCDDGSFVVCPYCYEPLSVEVEERRLAEYRRDPYERTPVVCRVCALDITRDSPLEERRIEGRSRGQCRHCGGSIIATAPYCHHCKRWQKVPFVRCGYSSSIPVHRVRDEQATPGTSTTALLFPG